MFRRIGHFFTDIFETLKRETGKLDINEKPIDFPFRLGSLKPHDPDNTITNASMLEEAFQCNDLKEDAHAVNIRGERDDAPPPEFFDSRFRLSVEVSDILRKENDESNAEVTVVEDDSFVFPSLVIESLTGEEETDVVVKTIDTGFPVTELSGHSTEVEPPAEFSREMIEPGDVTLENPDYQLEPRQIKDLETDFAEKQSGCFHLDYKLFTGESRITGHPVEFNTSIDQSYAAAVKFPVRRNRVARKHYNMEDIKRALSFIMKRHRERGKLKFIGIYRNVPIDSAERLAFSRDKKLYFYYAGRTNEKPIILDVLVLRSREGKYHVGPIIRKV